MKWRDLHSSSLLSFLFLSLLPHMKRTKNVFLSLSLSIESLTHSFFLSQNLTINYFLHNQSTSARINKRNVIVLSLLSGTHLCSLLFLPFRFESRIKKRERETSTSSYVVPLSFRSSPFLSPPPFLPSTFIGSFPQYSILPSLPRDK